MPFNRNKIKIISSANIQKLELLRHLAEFGAIAPSSHNTQPWFFQIGSDFIKVKPNTHRRLIYSDPKDRQFWLSIGAAMGNIKLAAEAYGLRYSVEDGTKIVLSSFEVGVPNEKLLLSLINRRTNRLFFKSNTIPDEIINQLHQTKHADIELIFLRNETIKHEVRNIVGDSAKAAFANKNFRNELSKWVKPSLTKYEDGMPGYVLQVPKLFSFILPFIIRYINIGIIQKKMHERWLKNAPVYAVISGPDSIEGWLNAGETLVRLTTVAEAEGVRNGIMGAPIEMENYAEQLRQAVSGTMRPQLFLRLGYAVPATYVSPRLNLNKTII